MNLTRVTLLYYHPPSHIAGQWITDSAYLTALRYYYNCKCFSFSCKTLFSDSSSIYIFFISIGLLFEPGLRALTRALLGPVNSLFQTEFTKVFSQSSLCWQKKNFFFLIVCVNVLSIKVFLAYSILFLFQESSLPLLLIISGCFRLLCYLCIKQL